jgi:hypothetical protein
MLFCSPKSPPYIGLLTSALARAPKKWAGSIFEDTHPRMYPCGERARKGTGTGQIVFGRFRSPLPYRIGTCPQPVWNITTT